ncbi:MAG: Integrase [Aeromicrobium sp.]|nr:Integrase [Aeromicrobium sp.]
MASIEKRIRDGRTVWRTHYRNPAGLQRNKTFARKVDTERFLAGVENSKNTGATAASLVIASGADVKVVQQMLSHTSATMTLDTCGHLFENWLDEVAEAMDLARRNHRRDAGREVIPLPRVAPCCPGVARDPLRPVCRRPPDRRFRRSGGLFPW